MHARIPCRPRRGRPVRLWVEALETRALLTAAAPGALALSSEAEPNDSLDRAHDLGVLQPGSSQALGGQVGNGSFAAADVDWYRFHLPTAARVSLATFGLSSDTVDAVLSLYNADLGALPVQEWAGAGISRSLPEGSYYLAVSGAGNLHFHPMLAGSGYEGRTGAYRLLLTASEPESDDSLDWLATFQIDAAEAAPDAPADDSPAGAHELGEIDGSGRIQQTGVIGDDPYWLDPLWGSPGADVDLYHFRISGPGRFRFEAELFAGRIGSLLDPGISLFRVDTADGLLHLVTANDSTLNAALSTDSQFYPLMSDAALFAGLIEGDYYLAVSSSGNVPDPDLGLAPGPDFGIFDPNVSHSGPGGFTTGAYVLNVQLQRDDEAPRVLAATLDDGAVLAGPLTRFTVQFDEPVNVQQLAYRAYLQTGQNLLEAVFLRAADGVDYYPRLESYDPVSYQTTFLMVDALPRGPAELYLSGAPGLADLAGLPLAGNDGASDYRLAFTVAGPERGSDDDPLRWTAREPNDSLAEAQDLGPLFYSELTAIGADGGMGIVLTRNFAETGSLSATDHADYYRFEVLHDATYLITLSGTALPPSTQPMLSMADGQAVPVVFAGDDILAHLSPGFYTIRVSGWPSEGATGNYRLRLAMLGRAENPTPLTVGPAPALRLRLLDVPTPVTLSPPIPPATEPTSPAGDATRAASTGKPGGAALPAIPPQGLYLSLATGPVGGVTSPVAGGEGARAQVVRLPGDLTPTLLASALRPLASLLLTPQPGGSGIVPETAQDEVLQPGAAAARGVLPSGMLPAVVMKELIRTAVQTSEATVAALLELARQLITPPAPLLGGVPEIDLWEVEPLNELSLPLNQPYRPLATDAATLLMLFALSATLLTKPYHSLRPRLEKAGKGGRR